MIKSIVLVPICPSGAHISLCPQPSFPPIPPIWGLSNLLELSLVHLNLKEIMLLRVYQPGKYYFKNKIPEPPLYRNNSQINILGQDLSQILDSYFQLYGGIFYLDFLLMSQSDSVILVNLCWSEPSARYSSGLWGRDAEESSLCSSLRRVIMVAAMYGAPATSYAIYTMLLPPALCLAVPWIFTVCQS